MTITDTTRLVRYIGNGATTAFPFSFLIPTEDDLVVSLLNLDTNELDVLDASDYSVTGIDDEGGGTVTYTGGGTPLPSTHAIIIKREVPYTQDTAITNQGAFQPEVLEEQLDRIVMQTQQLAEQVERSLRFVEGADVDEDALLLPEPEEGSVLAWSGGVLGNVAPGSVALAVPADLSVTTTKLANLAVTTAKLADDSVTADKLDSGTSGLTAIRELLTVQAKGDDIASAATVDLDSASGDWVNITGTTTISSFTLAEGQHRILRFGSALTITYGASSILTPGSRSYAVAAGDIALVIGGPAGADYFIPFDMARQQKGYHYIGTQVLTSGTTYTKTPGVRKIRVRGCGGGGGGGRGDSTGAGDLGAAGGGGAGAFDVLGVEVDVSAISTISYSIGAGGAGGTAATGAAGNGGATTFGTAGAYLSLGGGTGANNFTTSSIGAGQGGAGGTATTGSSGKSNGQPGFGGFVEAATGSSYWGGHGAGGPFGAGGFGGSDADGGNASGFGAGGGGSSEASASGTKNGGNGAPGVLFVEEYE